jgi:hypothetical protein
MKNRNYKIKSFTMIECIFAIFILSIISIYIISGINNFLHIQKENEKNINKLTDLENTVVIIKNNIKRNFEILNDVDLKKFEIKIFDLGELYNIKINYIEDMEKIYEIYISK